MSDDIKKGLLGIVVDETEVSKVMPEINSLTYRGYAAQDLCEYCRFEEVAYLILNKDLPNSIQLKQFEKEERNNRELSKNLYEIIKNIPKKSHPMDVARTAVSVMGLEDNETSNSSPEANMRKTLRIFAKTPTALAAFYRVRNGKKIIKPKKELSFAENFFNMCFGKVPQKEIVKAFDVSLILYAEHSFNVSTFTARTITSSLSDIHGAITGAIASLKGPLHGGANEEVMHMMRKIKKPENALKWINNALKNSSFFFKDFLSILYISLSMTHELLLITGSSNFSIIAVCKFFTWLLSMLGLLYDPRFYVTFCYGLLFSFISFPIYMLIYI